MKRFSQERWKRVTDGNTYWELDDVLHFGKYRGATLRQTIESDPAYIQYLMDEHDKLLSNEAYLLLQRCKLEERFGNYGD